MEDSKILAERITETLRSFEGVLLVAATDTEAATLDLLANQTVDVVILDLHLKQGTGFGVMRKFRPEQHPPTFIVLTNYDLPDYKEAALALGAKHFLDKARDYSLLPALLQRLHEAGDRRLKAAQVARAF